MTFKVGQSGNPGGRSTEKAVANAVRAAVNAPDPKTGRRKLELIAEMATNLAMSGEPWAVQFVADRLDGKPAQEQNIRIEDKRDASDWTRDELVTFLNDARNGGGGTVAPDRRNGGTDSVH